MDINRLKPYAILVGGALFILYSKSCTVNIDCVGCMHPTPAQEVIAGVDECRGYDFYVPVELKPLPTPQTKPTTDKEKIIMLEAQLNAVTGRYERARTRVKEKVDEYNSKCN